MTETQDEPLSVETHSQPTVVEGATAEMRSKTWNDTLQPSGKDTITFEGPALLLVADQLGDIPNATVSRAELLNRGFYFINAIGQGEKPIITQVGDRDYSKKALLTKEEFEYAQSHCSQVDDEPLNQGQLEALSDDMFAFIDEINTVLGGKALQTREGRVSECDMCLESFGWYLIHEGMMSSKPYMHVFGPHDTRMSRVSEIASLDVNPIPETLPTDVRGIPFNTLCGRIEHRAVHNPFLDQEGSFLPQGGFHILLEDTAENFDRAYYLIQKEGAPSLRWNYACSFLARYGICNTGTGAADQNFMTIEQYWKRIYSQRPQNDEPNPVKEADREWHLQMGREMKVIVVREYEKWIDNEVRQLESERNTTTANQNWVQKRVSAIVSWAQNYGEEDPIENHRACLEKIKALSDERVLKMMCPND